MQERWLMGPKWWGKADIYRKVSEDEWDGKCKTNGVPVMFDSPHGREEFSFEKARELVKKLNEDWNCRNVLDHGHKEVPTK